MEHYLDQILSANPLIRLYLSGPAIPKIETLPEESLACVLALSYNGMRKVDVEICSIKNAPPVPDPSYYRLSQALAEVCLPAILDAIRDSPSPDVEIWGTEFAHNCAWTAKYPARSRIYHPVIYFLMLHCLNNTAALRYTLSRRDEVLPQLVDILDLLYGEPHAVIMITTALGQLLLYGPPDELSSQLIHKYNILDLLATNLRAFTENDNKILNAIGRISQLCYLLVAMAKPSDCQLFRLHELYALLEKCRHKFPKIASLASGFPMNRHDLTHSRIYRAHFEWLNEEITGKGREFKTLQPGERIRLHRLSTYSVFCSLPDCQKKVDQDGILKHCKLCNLACYCDKTCQTRHWPDHAKHCVGKKSDEKTASSDS